MAIKLNRHLSRRPPVAYLVKANILPRECCTKVGVDAQTGDVVWGGGGAVAPSLLGMRRRVERERIKDGLKVGLKKVVERVNGIERREREDVRSVRALVRRFTAVRKRAVLEQEAESMRASCGGWRLWDKSEKDRMERAPTRAKVFGLRKYWEGIASA